MSEVTLNIPDKFTIDDTNSDDDHLYIDIFGTGTIVIHTADEGICVDVFPLHVVEEPVTSTWALYDELIPDREEDEDDDGDKQ
jgi:hypothetical protein